MYFNMMPKILLNLYGEPDMAKLVTDITTRISNSADIRENMFLYEFYDIMDGETPELVADRFYDEPTYHWIILLCNDIIDPIYEWPMSYHMLMTYAIHLYGEEGLYYTHHYEDENGNWVDASYPNCRHVTNIEYLEQENDKKRSIKILQPRYIDQFVSEVKAKLGQQVL